MILGSRESENDSDDKPAPFTADRHGFDLHGWHAAKELQGLVEAKIQEIETSLANAQVIDVKTIPETGRVIFGATIKLFDFENNKSVTYKLVGNLESDPEKGLISIDTPIAKGLLGKYVGDEVTISTPSGPIVYEVEKVSHI